MKIRRISVIYPTSKKKKRKRKNQLKERNWGVRANKAVTLLIKQWD